MHRLLAIDPSLTSSGWALFVDGILTDCGYVTTSPSSPMPSRIVKAAREVLFQTGAVDALAIEVPKHYERAKSKGDPNKLAPLWGITGAFTALSACSDVAFHYPRDWKGTVNPDVMMQRIYRFLNPEELATFHKGAKCKVCPKKTQKSGDTMDAIGVGLFQLKRMTAGGRGIQ